MKLLLLSSLLLGMSSASPPVGPLPDFLQPNPTPFSKSTDFVNTLPRVTPYLDSYNEEHSNTPHLEIRQNLAVDPNVEALDGVAVPTITTYSIAVQQGATAIVQNVVYTQSFALVPDQFPAPRQGVIGYGTLQKRAAEAEPTPDPGLSVVYIAQPVVLEMQTVMITQPLQRVTSVTVLQTMNVRTMASETTQAAAAATGTGQWLSGILPAPLASGSAAYRALPTASRWL